MKNESKRKIIFRLKDKISKLIKSIYYFLNYKLLFGKKLSMPLINSIKGKLEIELNDNSSCKISGFFMSKGPLYIKGIKKSKISIGKNVFFNHNCTITSSSSINIGDDCMFANNVTIIDHDHLINENGPTNELNSEKIDIGNKVWCGANVVILKGVSIGDCSVIAAGAVVNKSIPPYEIWGGVPAKRIKKIEKED